MIIYMLKNRKMLQIIILIMNLGKKKLFCKYPIFEEQQQEILKKNNQYVVMKIFLIMINLNKGSLPRFLRE